MNPNGEWSTPENLGYPINTKFDENSLMVSAEGDIAYFASNREGGFGDLDIYSFKLPKESQAIKTLYFDGYVYDKNSKKPLPGVFELFDLSTGERLIVSEADEITGTFIVPLPINRNYAISVTYEDYHPYSLNFDLLNDLSINTYHLDIPMNKSIAINAETDTNGIILTPENVFKNVFFDLNKSFLRKESQIELNLFAEYLKKNPKMKIVLEGHTDSRGNQIDNIKLSTARALSVYTYLTLKGISENRMSHNGYGSSNPIIKDEEIQDMTNPSDKEAAHQKNRRTVWREIL
jgi:outer membrane protein OmpA-like peptidoglycan-associated protein